VGIGPSWLGHRLANFLDRPTQADSILNSLYISALAGQRDRSSLVLSGAKSLTPDHPMTNSAACATIGARTHLGRIVAGVAIKEHDHIQGSDARARAVTATLFYLSPAQFLWYALWFMANGSYRIRPARARRTIRIRRFRSCRRVRRWKSPATDTSSSPCARHRQRTVLGWSGRGPRAAERFCFAQEPPLVRR
jgi:hypothetical protein